MSEVTLYCDDCLRVMPELATGSIDLTVTSPPYDNLRTYGKGFDANSFDWHPIIAELYRVTKQGGVVVWVVADATIKGSETGTSFRQALWAMECGFNLHDTMIYQKSAVGACGSNYAYWQAFEYMFVFSKDHLTTINRIRDRHNSTAGTKRSVSPKNIHMNKRGGNRRLTIAEYGIRQNVWRYDVGSFAKSDDSTSHPAPFPEALARDHILSWSNPGDTVLDPMMGSGTTGKMAIKLQRGFIGIELDRDYFEIAQQRIADARLQLFLL